ncbi:MAG: hypothetical protein WCR24_07525 [Candidatus Methanomethylophilaceae archaeon]
MFKVINGKRYSTETSRKVAEYDNGRPVNDFNHYEETLFCKKTGEYFLYGEGGPASKYARETGQNSWSGGEAIIPLSLDNAKEWAENAMDGDDYEKEFGEIDESEDKCSVNIRLTPGIRDEAKQMALVKNVTLSQLIEDLIVSARSMSGREE